MPPFAVRGPFPPSRRVMETALYLYCIVLYICMFVCNIYSMSRYITFQTSHFTHDSRLVSRHHQTKLTTRSIPTSLVHSTLNITSHHITAHRDRSLTSYSLPLHLYSVHSTIRSTMPTSPTRWMAVTERMGEKNREKPSRHQGRIVSGDVHGPSKALSGWVPTQGGP